MKTLEEQTQQYLENLPGSVVQEEQRQLDTYGVVYQDGLKDGMEMIRTPQDVIVKDKNTLKNILSDISFENTSLDFNWEFEIQNQPVFDHGQEIMGWFVNVAFQRPDTDTGLIGTGRGRKEFIPINSWESSVVKTAWLLVELVVRHELMEAFRWKGKRIFNPHNSVHVLANIQKDE